MEYIDIHAHMVSRTTDDYRQMAMAGCVALTEPAFWPGWDRSSAGGFEDYFRQLTGFEPARAAEYGIRHYTWLCLNPKEGENRALAREVLARIRQFLDRPNVLGIGESGLNRNTRNELATFRDHVELALEHDLLIHIHTPHLEDKYKGTRLIVETLLQYPELKPERVLIDHPEEHTLAMILEPGFWTGLTLYPQTKTSPQRAIDMIETDGPERICVASACDWGPSLYRARSITADIRRVLANRRSDGKPANFNLSLSYMNLISRLQAAHDRTLPLFGLPEADLEKRYASGKWSVRFILHHLADTETVLYDRIRRVISEPRQVIQAFDQDAWAARLKYASFPLGVSQRIFSAVREAVIYQARAHYEETGHLEFVHSEGGVRTLRDEFEKVAWHNERHLTQIDDALSRDPPAL